VVSFFLIFEGLAFPCTKLAEAMAYTKERRMREGTLGILEK
jgi:hypothetical protein